MHTHTTTTTAPLPACQYSTTACRIKGEPVHDATTGPCFPFGAEIDHAVHVLIIPCRIKGKPVDDVMTIKNSDIAKHLSLPPVKLHCSMLAGACGAAPPAGGGTADAETANAVAVLGSATDGGTSLERACAALLLWGHHTPDLPALPLGRHLTTRSSLQLVTRFLPACRGCHQGGRQGLEVQAGGRQAGRCAAGSGGLSRHAAHPARAQGGHRACPAPRRPRSTLWAAQGRSSRPQRPLIRLHPAAEPPRAAPARLAPPPCSHPVRL